jgi:F-type H+-transporting ATPase subunit b
MIPDITTLWVVFLLLLCTVILNTLIFKPILRIIDERSNAVRGARELAESASTKAAAAAAEYDRKLNAARSEVYAQIDATRRTALDQRAHLLAETRQAVERETQSATAQVAQESAAARASLDREATDLANAIVARVLDRAS